MWQVTAQSEVALPKAWLGALSKVNLKPLTLLRFYLLGWAQPHVQHDVAELATLLLRNLGWVPCAISWCRRFQVAGVSGTFRQCRTRDYCILIQIRACTHLTYRMSSDPGMGSSLCKHFTVLRQ